jgi:hypothetical protein
VHSGARGMEHAQPGRRNGVEFDTAMKGPLGFAIKF